MKLPINLVASDIVVLGGRRALSVCSAWQFGTIDDEVDSDGRHLLNTFSDADRTRNSSQPFPDVQGWEGRPVACFAYAESGRISQRNS